MKLFQLYPEALAHLACKSPAAQPQEATEPVASEPTQQAQTEP